MLHRPHLPGGTGHHARIQPILIGVIVLTVWKRWDPETVWAYRERTVA